MDAPSLLELSRTVVLILILVIAAYTDLAHGKIYNWYTIPATILGFFGCFLEGHLRQGIFFNDLLISSLLGFVLGFGIFFMLFLSGGFGAGDMKFMGAIGALTGWNFVLTAMIYSSLIGAMMGFGVLIWHGKFWKGFGDSIRLLFTINKSRYAEEKKTKTEEIMVTIPYGLAISIGTLWAFFMTFFQNL